MSRISFEEFDAAITSIRNFMKKRDELGELVKKLSPSSFVVVEFGSDFIESQITFLSNLVNDKAEWIAWFIYENDFGKKKMEAGKVGATKKIKNTKDLWDICLK